MCPTSSQVRSCSSMEMHSSLLLSGGLHLVMHDALQYRRSNFFHSSLSVFWVFQLQVRMVVGRIRDG